MTARFRIRRAGAIVVCAALIIVGGQYIFDAWKRQKASECYSVTSHNSLYRAESCVTGGDGNLLFYVGRLYDTHSGELLARVDFDSLEGGTPSFMPDDSAVDFEGAHISDAGGLNIPPRLIDRLRAKIP